MKPVAAGILVSLLLFVATVEAQEKRDFRVHQYYFDEISIPPASADEPLAARLSLTKAASYLDDGAMAWAKDRGCVSCHTTGWYGIIRPQLTASLGAPGKWFRGFLEDVLDESLIEDPAKLRRGTGPAQVIYLAAALASWDAHLGRRLSPQTDEALDLMFSLQGEDGSWSSVETWPPFESDAFQLATVAAMAAGLAPDWIEDNKDEELGMGVSRLKHYLRNTAPPHDYARVALLWASQYMPGLLDARQKTATVELILSRQRTGGGWSLRSFAEPEQWGVGNRAERLHAEDDRADPASDGHQTGLAVLVLLGEGTPASHPAIERGVDWLTRHQRVSGRWWTRSLNTDKWNFITYTGTLYPVAALNHASLHPADSE